MEALVVIYLIALPFTFVFMNAVLEAVPESSNMNKLMVFLSVWMVLPLFPIYLLVRRFKK